MARSKTNYLLIGAVLVVVAGVIYQKYYPDEFDKLVSKLTGSSGSSGGAGGATAGSDVDTATLTILNTNNLDKCKSYAKSSKPPLTDKDCFQQMYTKKGCTQPLSDAVWNEYKSKYVGDVWSQFTANTSFLSSTGCIKPIPVDAKCRGEVTEDVYEFDTSRYVKGSDIAREPFDYESFALSNNIITRTADVDPNRLYLVGRRVKSIMTTPPRYNGAGCGGEYQDVVFMAQEGSMVASKCLGSDCSLEGQMCYPGTEGSSGKTWKCINRKWVEQDPCGVGNKVTTRDCYLQAWKEKCTNTPSDGQANWGANAGMMYEQLVADANANPECKHPIQERKGVSDLGYPNDSNKEFKRGWYDIMNQGANNDFCRYVGDGAGFFACVLADGSNAYATTYKGRNVTDIAREKQYTAELLLFRLKQKSSSMCIHPSGGTANDGTVAVYWPDCSDDNRIKYRHLPNGQIQHVASGKCLHPEGGSAGNGTSVVFWGDCSNNPQYQYRLLPNGQIQHVATGMCLHPSGGSDNPGQGTRMVFWNDCSNAARIQYSLLV